MHTNILPHHPNHVSSVHPRLKRSSVVPHVSPFFPPTGDGPSFAVTVTESVLFRPAQAPCVVNLFTRLHANAIRCRFCFGVVVVFLNKNNLDLNVRNGGSGWINRDQLVNVIVGLEQNFCVVQSVVKWF